MRLKNATFPVSNSERHGVRLEIGGTAERVTIGNGASINDAGCRIVQPAHGLRSGQGDTIS